MYHWFTGTPSSVGSGVGLPAPAIGLERAAQPTIV
jgi:hypothetical protein